MNFPLYDSLNTNLPKKDLSVKQKEYFVNNVNNINISGKELIYVLIHTFYILNTDANTDEVPFKGIKNPVRTDKDNVSWNFTDFPIKLRHILYNFLTMHIKKMEEENRSF